MSDWKLGVWGLRKPSRTSTVGKLYFHIVLKKYCEDKLFCLVEQYTLFNTQPPSCLLLAQFMVLELFCTFFKVTENRGGINWEFGVHIHTLLYIK